MTEARSIAKDLRKLMNANKWTISDVMRGLVVIANGRLIDAVKPPQEPQTCIS